MKKFLTLTAIAILPLLFASCGHGVNPTEKVIRRDTIRVKGSDTEFAMVKHLADAYMAGHLEVIILVEGGGSNKGIEALMNHKTDICNSSREISTEEVIKAMAVEVKPVPIMFSVDALAIITNYKIGIDSLSTNQISSLFKGEIKNWKDLKGPDQQVKVFGRDKSSGTHDYFNEKFLENKSNGQVNEKATNLEVLNSVINTPGAIGYVSTGFLFDSVGKPNGKIWAVPVYINNHLAVSPYQLAAVKKGDYIITRPLYQYVNGTPNQLIQDFMLFELTSKGQDIILSHGFFPINDYQTQINRLKGLLVE